jgi:hypothetical protein
VLATRASFVAVSTSMMCFQSAAARLKCYQQGQLQHHHFILRGEHDVALDSLDSAEIIKKK